MMQISFDVEKGTGITLGNALRQLCMSRLGCWAPVAFSLNRDISLISASSDIVQDTYRIMANLSKLQISPKFTDINEEMVSETFKFFGTLKPGNMGSELFSISGSDEALITSVGGGEVELRVLYRYGSGAFKSSENANFLQENGEDPKSYFVMASRHTNVKTFTYNVLVGSSSKEKLVLDVVSTNGNESEIVFETIKTLEGLVGMLKSEFSATTQ